MQNYPLEGIPTTIFFLPWLHAEYTAISRHPSPLRTIFFSSFFFFKKNKKTSVLTQHTSLQIAVFPPLVPPPSPPILVCPLQCCSIVPLAVHLLNFKTAVHHHLRSTPPSTTDLFIHIYPPLAHLFAHLQFFLSLLRVVAASILFTHCVLLPSS